MRVSELTAIIAAEIVSNAHRHQRLRSATLNATSFTGQTECHFIEHCSFPPSRRRHFHIFARSAATLHFFDTSVNISLASALLAAFRDATHGAALLYLPFLDKHADHYLSI